MKVIDLHKAYGSHQVLKGINFELDAGKVYGLVGENGAGKTTLYECLVGWQDFQGKVDLSREGVQLKTAYLQTSPPSLSLITGWEYLKLLSLAREVHEEDFERKNLFELPLGEYIQNYSTGMLKKLALLGILLQDNDLFLLDEPYSGVDLQSSILITEIIRELAAANKFILISSHIFSALKDCCDEIFYLKDGLIQDRIMKRDFSKFEDDLRQNLVADKLKVLGLGKERG